MWSMLCLIEDQEDDLQPFQLPQHARHGRLTLLHEEKKGGYESETNVMYQ